MDWLLPEGQVPSIPSIEPLAACGHLLSSSSLLPEVLEIFQSDIEEKGPYGPSQMKSIKTKRRKDQPGAKRKMRVSDHMQQVVQKKG